MTKPRPVTWKEEEPTRHVIVLVLQPECDDWFQRKILSSPHSFPTMLIFFELFMKANTTEHVIAPWEIAILTCLNCKFLSVIFSGLVGVATCRNRLYNHFFPFFKSIFWSQIWFEARANYGSPNHKKMLFTPELVWFFYEFADHCRSLEYWPMPVSHCLRVAAKRRTANWLCR